VTFLAPLAFAALAVPLGIYLVHWLFGTRRRQVVPALFLWTDLPQAATGRRKRRIPPFSWLLLIQLAAAAAGVLALARPAVPGQAQRHVALILDAGATMQATDVAPSRFQAALRALDARLDTLRPDDLVSLVQAGKDATLLGSGTPSSVRAVLQQAKPGQAPPAIREALALASTRVAATPDRRPSIVLFTDGAWPAPESVGPLRAPVEIVPTGGGSDNQAVVAAVVRQEPTGRGQAAFIDIANESERAVRVPLQVTADAAPLDARQLEIKPRSDAQLSIPLPADARHITVQLVGRDALAADDKLDVLAPGGPPREVDVLGRVSEGMQRAIESIPSLHVRTGDSTAPADLSVLVGVLPARLPPGPLLLVDPPANSARLLGVGLGNGARIEPADPLLQGLDLAALQDLTPSISGVPGWAHVALGNQQGPLLMHGVLEGHPVVSMTFDPAVSGLEKSLAFPLLMSNASTYLLAQSDPAVAPSQTEPFDFRESDIRPRPVPTFGEVVSADATPAPASAEIWPWLAAGALMLLGLEWLVFARRG
jgi:Ca-activated chloride channel homolog